MLVAFLALGVVSFRANSQQPQHLYMSMPSGDRVSLTATNIDMNRDGSALRVVRLSGNVEVRMTICGPDGEKKSCRGSVVVHADRGEYNVRTGEFQPRGNVRVTPGPVE